LPAMFGSATLTIDESMIAMITPSITVAVMRARGGSARWAFFETAAILGRPASAREAMTATP
jgi:hypothetical protein